MDDHEAMLDQKKPGEEAKRFNTTVSYSKPGEEAKRFNTTVSYSKPGEEAKRFNTTVSYSKTGKEAKRFNTTVICKMPDGTLENKLKLDGETRSDEQSGQNDTKIAIEEQQNKGLKSECEEKTMSLNQFSFALSLAIMEKNKLKRRNGELFLYKENEGYFERIKDEDLKVFITQNVPASEQVRLNIQSMNEVIHRLKTAPELICSPEEFNAKYDLMNFKNGVVEIRSGKLLPHSWKFGFTSCIQAKYSPTFCSFGRRFTAFLKKLTNGDRKKEDLFQEIVGYVLSEYNQAKIAPVFLGKPHSGKSMFLRVLTRLLGEEQVSHADLSKLHERFMLAHLSEKKVNIASEIGSDALKHIEIFKAITGNDELVAEYKGKNHFSYKSRIKLVFAGNEMPKLSKTEKTSAFFDRLLFVCFNHTVPAGEREQNLDELLFREEADWIATWAVAGIKRLVEGNFRFTECEESKKFKERYIAEQDSVGDFLDSWCEFAQEKRVHSRVLYEKYKEYCRLNCLASLGTRELSSLLDHRGCERKKFRINGNSPLWGYEGVGLKEDMAF